MEPQKPQTERERTDYDKELSVGTYAGKKIYEVVVSLGTTAAGMWGGLAAAGKFVKPHTDEAITKAAVNIVTGAAPGIEEGMRLPGFLGKLPGLKQAFTNRQLAWGAGGGFMAGSILGGLFLGYEHWQKVKREQLQVDEITKDISDIEVFKKTDPELAAENKRLWAELNKREAQPAVSSHVEKHAPDHANKEHGDKKHAEHHAKKDDRAESWEEAVHTSKNAEHHQEAAR